MTQKCVIIESQKDFMCLLTMYDYIGLASAIWQTKFDLSAQRKHIYYIFHSVCIKCIHQAYFIIIIIKILLYKYSVNDRWFEAFMLIYFYWANQRFRDCVCLVLVFAFYCCLFQHSNQTNFKWPSYYHVQFYNRNSHNQFRPSTENEFVGETIAHENKKRRRRRRREETPKPKPNPRTMQNNVRSFIRQLRSIWFRVDHLLRCSRQWRKSHTAGKRKGNDNRNMWFSFFRPFHELQIAYHSHKTKIRND